MRMKNQSNWKIYSLITLNTRNNDKMENIFKFLMFLLSILERQIINVLVIHKNELVKKENGNKKR